MNRPELTPPPEGERHPSPPLVLLAVVHAVLLLASALVRTAQWQAFLQLGAAVPLGLFSAAAASRLQFLGLRAAGVFLGFFGGVVASALLALSALLEWVLTAPALASSPEAVRALHLAALSVGGPGSVLFFGILVAGVSVTAGLGRLVPRWLMTSGLVIAVLAELSWLSLVLDPAAYLVPLARLLGLVWLIAAGALLPRSRAEAAEREARRREPRGAGTQPAAGTAR